MSNCETRTASSKSAFVSVLGAAVIALALAAPAAADPRFPTPPKLPASVTCDNGFEGVLEGVAWSSTSAALTVVGGGGSLAVMEAHLFFEGEPVVEFVKPSTGEGRSLTTCSVSGDLSGTIVGVFAPSA